MASKYDWEFIRPLDQTANISALSQGNQQINAGLQGMGQAITGYADAMKQRNTDEIMNALYQAQTSSDLPNAMQAVQALQQQYGRGYDQTAVRNAIDTRGSTLGQRDLQAINLQQAQAAQAAIPQLNASAIAQAKARGVDTGPLEALAALGIDTTGQINSYANNSVSDTRDSRDFKYKSDKDTRDFNYRKERDVIGDRQWAEGNNRANIQAMASLAEHYVTPAQSGYIVDSNGNIQTYQTGGTTFSDAMSVMPSIFQAESGNTHRKADGSLVRSSAGALGVAQIMPATAAKPGYGMKPINLHTSSPEEQKAWATEYIGKIQKAHNFTTEQAVAAYNAGAGKVQTAIKQGGANWLSKLPKETQNYVPKVMGGARQGNVSQATASMGPMVSQANMSKVTSGYQDAMAKLNADFAAQSAKDQVKGSLATTGKNVDTWAASKKDTGLIFSSNNSFFTKASDLTKMAKADPAFNKLPESAQINVLEGAYAKLNDVNAFQYVPDGDLKKFISRESQNYQKDRINQHEQAKNAVFEQSYQNLVQSFQAAGSRPPSREAARQLFDPQYKAPAPKPAPAQPKPQQQAQPKAPATPAVKQESAMDKHMRERAERKKAEWAVVEKRLAKEKADKEAKAKAEQAKKPVWMGGNAQGNNMFKNVGTGSLTQAQLDKMIKNFNAR